MSRRYPHWLRLLLIACLLLNLGQLAYAVAPLAQDDCNRHCQMSSKAMDTHHGSHHHHGMSRHTAATACCGGMQGCGHCAHCSLISLLSGPPDLSRVVIFRYSFAESPVYPVGLVPPLHEHPPRV